MSKEKIIDVEEDNKYSISLHEQRTIYVKEGEKVDLIKSANLPHFDIEDQKNWKSHKIGDNPNLIGQVHMIGAWKEMYPVFHLCYNPEGRMLTLNDMKSIVKSMEYSIAMWEAKQ